MASHLTRTFGLAHGKPFQKAESNGPEQAQRVEGQRDMSFHVYILRLNNDQFYVGSTDDLARRWAEHKAGTACRTTAICPPAELLYSEPHPNRSSARLREVQIKRWSRAKKFALIQGNITELKKLARSNA
jgi:predicted GIY-YIG superfamily endonuclease